MEQIKNSFILIATCLAIYEIPKGNTIGQEHSYAKPSFDTIFIQVCCYHYTQTWMKINMDSNNHN